MRKLALSDEILLKISQPARYIGGEVNMVKKDPSKVAVRFAMCFPDVYEIGMSHLGIQILYDMFNKREDMWCERVYFPMAGSGPRDAGTEHSAVRPGIPGAGEKRGFPVYHPAV